MTNKNFNRKKAHPPSHIFKLIADIRDLRKRNLLRGYSAKHSLTSRDMEAIRHRNSPQDSMIIGAILKGPDGISYRSNYHTKKTAADIFVMTGFPSVDWRNEIHYTAGYINSTGQSALELIQTITPLAMLETLDTATALGILHELSKKYGASNFLSYKLAYLRSARNFSETELNIVSQIEAQIHHQDNAGFHFSALENLSSKISLFEVAQRRVNSLITKVNGDFRRAISLSNFIPTPLNEDDVAGFLLRATESCLVDTVYATIIIFNLARELPSVYREFVSCLSPNFCKELLNLIEFASGSKDEDIVTDIYHMQDKYSDSSLDLYRVASAFLERPALAMYRNKLDRVIGVRLLAEIIDGKLYALSAPFVDKTHLLASNGANLAEPVSIKLDAFYRTYLFLRFIGNRANLLTMSKDEARFVFENTVGLEYLLTETEMRALYVTAPPETKGLMAVLALALFRKKSIDPDVDFEFRSDFISYVIAEHHGSILEFINYLLSDSPQVASYIVSSLDEATLEKMYKLVGNASQASRIRCDILKAVGQKLNRIEYFIEADAITTRAKVSKLQQYFDSSRIYVDSVSMKKWLDSNPTISTEQYRSLYSRVKARVASVEDVVGAGKNLLIIQLNDQDEYLISQIAKDAFEQFCLNTEFGVQSYLGRRIRHNTLDGVMMDTVDAVLRKPEHAVCMRNSTMRRAVDVWMMSYKAIIDRLRREYLQFKAPNSLFRADLDLSDTATQDNLRQLRSTLRTSGASELLNDLVIAFCWKQITPQLENAARFIRNALLREANASIDKAFLGHRGGAEAQLKAELHEAVNEVFKKVADWFQVPQTGFISATGKELCEIILLDLNLQRFVQFSGNAVNAQYTGISVHRLYDCLAVLLQNAAKHREQNSAISLDIHRQREPGTTLDLVTVVITNKVVDRDYATSKERILAAIATEEAGVDMVTEGYTGIKKIKFITRASEGSHTVACTAEDSAKELRLSFCIHAEAVNDEGGDVV